MWSFLFQSTDQGAFFVRNPSTQPCPRDRILVLKGAQQFGSRNDIKGVIHVQLTVERWTQRTWSEQNNVEQIGLL